MLAFSKHDTVYVSSTQANGAGFIKAFIYMCASARARAFNAWGYVYRNLKYSGCLPVTLSLSCAK